MRASIFLLALVGLALPVRGETLVIRNARVIAAPDKVLPRATVVIVKGKIAAVGETVKEPPLARVLDGSGRTLAPGFVCAATGMGEAVRMAERPGA